MAPRANRLYALVAGGGTAGHVLPALAVAEALVARGHDRSSIELVGGRRGPEGAMSAEAGFAATLLPGRGIPRRLSPAALAAAAGVLVGLLQAVVLVARRRPRVVLSVGGYAAAPASIAAVLLRVPLVLHDQNAYPGALHRLVGRFARASAVSFAGTPLPRAVVTGNPVRPELRNLDRSPAGRQAARGRLGVPPGHHLIGAFGGSLGSRRINEAVFGVVERWAGRQGIALRHAVGSRDWSSARPPKPPAGGLAYQPVEYEHHMADLLAAADVMVCRAGGSTVAELACAGVPSVLVPLPQAPNDHQTRNAEALVAAGAAVLIPDDELDAGRLEEVLDMLVADPSRLAAMAAAARSQGRPDAAEQVADLVERHARV